MKRQSERSLAFFSSFSLCLEVGNKADGGRRRGKGQKKGGKGKEGRKEGGGVRRRRKMLISRGCIASAALSDKDPVAIRQVQVARWTSM